MPIFNIVKLLALLCFSSLSLALIDNQEFKLLCDYPEQNKINILQHKVVQTNIDDFKTWLANSNIDSIYTSPLVYAVARNNIFIITLLLDACLQYRINYWELTTSTGMSMLTVAASEQHVDAIRLLLKYKHPVSMDKENTTSALHQAALKHNIEICRLIIEQDSQLIHCKDNNSMTPINYLINNNVQYYVLNLLEEFPANKKMIPLDANGRSYLHYAIANYMYDLIHYLLKVGFDYKQKDCFGTTPLDLSRHQQNKIILQILDTEKKKRKRKCCCCLSNILYKLKNLSKYS